MYINDIAYMSSVRRQRVLTWVYIHGGPHVVICIHGGPHVVICIHGGPHVVICIHGGPHVVICIHGGPHVVICIQHRHHYHYSRALESLPDFPRSEGGTPTKQKIELKPN